MTPVLYRMTIRFSSACAAVNKSFAAGVIVKFLPYWLFRILKSIGAFSWFTDYEKWNKTTVQDFVNVRPFFFIHYCHHLLDFDVYL
jgi:hypothetical protein